MNTWEIPQEGDVMLYGKMRAEVMAASPEIVFLRLGDGDIQPLLLSDTDLQWIALREEIEEMP